MGELRDRIERDGYVVARGLLSARDIERLRAALAAHFRTQGRVEGLGKHQPDAAVLIAGIAWVFSHPGIIAMFREILGATPVFTGNCDAHRNMLSFWHKDVGAADRLGDDLFASPSCGLYRAGIYLQDHRRNRDGLTVRTGSHRINDLDQGEVTYLETEPGDVVFFDGRLSHAGKLADPVEDVLLRAARRWRRDAVVARVKDWYWRITLRRDRYSLFFTFGRQTRVFEAFCAADVHRRRERSPGAAPYLSPELVQGLESAGATCHALCRPPMNLEP